MPGRGMRIWMLPGTMRPVIIRGIEMREIVDGDQDRFRNHKQPEQRADPFCSIDQNVTAITKLLCKLSQIYQQKQGTIHVTR